MSKPGAILQVYLVDDSALVRASLAELLTTAAQVRVSGAVGSVAQALPAISAGRPDVVILDLDLPDGSGLQVLHATRQMNPAPVVIILTMYPFNVYGEQCLAAGAAFYLEKGGRIERVLEVLDELSRPSRPGGGKAAQRAPARHHRRAPAAGTAPPPRLQTPST